MKNVANLLAVVTAAFCASTSLRLTAATEPALLADPLVGVAGQGSCMPGPCMPHGSAYPSPDSLYPYPGRRFAPPAGVFWGDPVVGFSQLHTQGTGGTPTYGLFLVSPRTGAGVTEAENVSSLADIEARVFRFRGTLAKWGVKVELAPTAHGAVYGFDFPATNDARLVFNVARKIGLGTAMTHGSVVVDPRARTVSGGGTFTGNWNPGPYEAYFYGEFDAAPTLFGTWSGTERMDGSVSASIREPSPLGVWCAFDTRTNRTVHLRLAVSFKSVDQAKAWLRAEARTWDPGTAADRAKAAWNRELAAVTPEGLDAAAARTFYSHLFHAFVQPRDRTGDFAGWPASTPVWDDHYTLWDTWKTLFPLMAIVRPDVVAGNVNSFAARLAHDGACSAAFIQGRDYRVGQGGDEADNVIADAFAKRVPGIDWNGAWSVLAANAARRTPEYRAMGYMPSDVTKHDYCSRLRSGSATLAFAYEDWCAAEVAAGLGKTDGAARLRARSANWTNVWDNAAVDAPSGYHGFVRGRLASGAFGVPDEEGGFGATPPREGFNTDFYEGTCWDYSYVVPHDIPGIVSRMGGPEKFSARLEYALENELIDFGNEPSFMTIWLFDYVGRPDLASKWASQLRGMFPADGTPGDDDSGAMGSLYVFLTAGFFPIAGQDIYALHGPAVPKISFHVPATGRIFTVIGHNAGGKNIYVQSATLDGHPLATPFIHHADILAGATLEFTMGPEPRIWTSAPAGR